MNLEAYFAAPIFQSWKSTYTLHYQTELEKRLMMYFDSKVEVADYFQPLMTVSVIFENNECFLDIDFWVEYQNGQTALVHIENENSFTKENQMKAFECSMQLDGFNLIVISGNKFRQPQIRKLKFNFPTVPNQCHSKWLN